MATRVPGRRRFFGPVSAPLLSASAARFHALLAPILLVLMSVSAQDQPQVHQFAAILD
jgi:hypothetical protein